MCLQPRPGSGSAPCVGNANSSSQLPRGNAAGPRVSASAEQLQPGGTMGVVLRMHHRCHMHMVKDPREAIHMIKANASRHSQWRTRWHDLRHSQPGRHCQAGHRPSVCPTATLWGVAQHSRKMSRYRRRQAPRHWYCNALTIAWSNWLRNTPLQRASRRAQRQTAVCFSQP